MKSNTAISIYPQNIIHFADPVIKKGWRYLLADSVIFQKCSSNQQGHSIRLQKPEKSQLFGWIKRLILSDQCETIYVENLELAEHEKLIIKDLCLQHRVSLIGLTIAPAQNDEKSSNVIRGPW